MKPKAQYHIVGHDYGNGGLMVVLIEDLNGPMSVTNDAEAVVRELIASGWGAYRFMYKDSMGNWDELLHDGKQFTGFGPGYNPTVV